MSENYAINVVFSTPLKDSEKEELKQIFEDAKEEYLQNLQRKRAVDDIIAILEEAKSDNVVTSISYENLWDNDELVGRKIIIDCRKD